MPIRVAVVVAGSIGFTRRQIQDILGVPDLQDIEFAFTDINERNLDTGITRIRLGTPLVGCTVRVSEQQSPHRRLLPQDGQGVLPACPPTCPP